MSASTGVCQFDYTGQYRELCTDQGGDQVPEDPQQAALRLRSNQPSTQWEQITTTTGLIQTMLNDTSTISESGPNWKINCFCVTVGGFCDIVRW